MTDKNEALRWNPMENGNFETALQMAAVIAHRDAELEILRTGYAAARLEIESLRAGGAGPAGGRTPQPAPQQEAQEPVAWRELCRRLYVELFYCNQQMTSGKRPKWQQGKTLRDVLADAKAALDAARQPSPASQGDALDTVRLDWMGADESKCVFHLGKSWYTRPSYGMPYRKRASLREAIDAARAAQEVKSHDN